MLAAVVGGCMQPAGGLVKDLCKCLYSQFTYVKDVETYFEKLQVEKGYLYSRRDDVNIEKNSSEPRKMPSSECENWLGNVGKVEVKLKALETKYSARRCWKICSVLKLSKDMKKMADKVRELKDEEIKNVLVDRPAALLVKKEVVRTTDVPSINGYVQAILDYLRDDCVWKIGIWGMAGVGKTTIMKNLNNYLEDDQGVPRMFDIVIWVKELKGLSVREIQQELVQRLRLNVKDIDSMDLVADMISNYLKTRKYLLLLDEVFSEINLEDLGIYESHSGKVVLATRDRRICCSMGTDKDINVKKLSEHDAWELFMQKLGPNRGYVNEHPRIKPLAKLLVKECGFLPKVTTAVAATLRGAKDEQLWRNALTKLQSPSTYPTKPFEDVFKAFKHCYDQLRSDQSFNDLSSNDDKQSCLLYGALYPDDYEINQNYLMECWRAERFITDDDKDLSSARDSGHCILEILIDGCLLERSERREEYIKMPYVFKRIAGRVKSTNQVNYKLLVRTGDYEESPADEEWEQARWISLACSQLSSLPERPDCQVISTLLLQQNPNLTIIPEFFFDNMSSLRIVDLYKNKIKSLPPSLSILINLRGLYLNVCSHLVELPTQIAQLKNLEFLDIRRTGITALPNEIGELTCLKCLRVSFTTCADDQNHIQERAMIPQNVFLRLKLLEELTIDVDPQDKRWHTVADAVSNEVASLKYLNTLAFYFPTMNCFHSFIVNCKSLNCSSSSTNKFFRAFRILVSDHDACCYHGSNDLEYSAQRYLRFSASKDTPAAILKLLDQASAFVLVRHCNVKKLCEFDTERMKVLKVCVIEECREMTCIVDGNGKTDTVFPCLEKLHITKLLKLECIWKGSVHSNSLVNLTITLKECPKLKKIFSKGVIQQLSLLQHLRIEDCIDIVEIIIKDENEILESKALPQLKKLELFGLKELISICEGDCLDWPSLERIEIETCEKLKTLPLRVDNAAKLRSIVGNDSWWNALVWSSVTIKQRFQPFYSLN